MKNIVLFSSGISEKNGLLFDVKNLLEEYGYRCYYWRDLFKLAKDPSNIALLPSLIKKIPTFDYAVLICEGHDKTIMLRNCVPIEVESMRDNVLFEIGLCVMALGLSRTILVTDSEVHLPEDLSGKNGSLAIPRFIYKKELGSTNVVEKISEYIVNHSDQFTPVVIGAASSSAEGYVNNFLLRSLEHLEDGVYINDRLYHFSLNDVFVHLILPQSIDEHTALETAKRLSKYDRGVIPTARSRSAVFRCEIINDKLHIYDFPTSMITSYHTAKMILEIDADDEEDAEAAERFTSKEIKLFKSTVLTLAKEAYVKTIIENYYPNLSVCEREEMIHKICTLFENRLEILSE